MEGPSFPLRLIAAIVGLAGATAADAGEVLFLRIRPQPDLAAVGAGGGADTASASRLAAWQRSNARARRIIETVCTGCLGPWIPPQAQIIAAAAISDNPEVRGLETDRPVKASDATPDPSIPERRP